MKLQVLIVLLFLCFHLSAQPNCELYVADAECYKACHLALKAIRYPQGSYTSQQYFAESIKKCPNFAYAYRLLQFLLPHHLRLTLQLFYHW